MVALLSLCSGRLVIVVWLFHAVPWVCLQFVIVVFPYHTQLLFLYSMGTACYNLLVIFYHYETPHLPAACSVQGGQWLS